MFDIGIKFSHPWLLLLLIPALALTLIPHLRLVKRYRRNRNRITSLVLHLVVMLLAVLILSGFQVTYSKYNNKNELILLVDMSDSGEKNEAARDELVETLLRQGGYDGISSKIITFGFDQIVASDFNTDADKSLQNYINAPLPDLTATDIAAALELAKESFNNPKTGKIVLITDGKETDEKVLSAVPAVLAKGIMVDIAYIPTDLEENDADIQVTNIQFPEQHIDAGTPCEIKVAVRSTKSVEAKIKLFDNEKENTDNTETFSLIRGENVCTLKHTFEANGVHSVRAEVTTDEDEWNTNNNRYVSYHLVDTFNRVLILESVAGQSEKIREILVSDDRFNVEKNGETIKIVDITGSDVPTTIDELIQYDEVILNNISNGDLARHEGLDELLYTYVHDFGGGMLTVGGKDSEGNAHAYNRADMFETLFQEMLPVQAVNYTPPVGVVVIIDISGSMKQTLSDGSMLYEWGLAGAKSCLNALTERDYFGIMTMNSSYTSVLQLTSCMQKDEIIESINQVRGTEDQTYIAPAYRRAVQALISQKNIDKKHIVFLTDYGIYDRPEFESLVETYNKSDDITLSIVGINIETGLYSAALHAAEDLGGGRLITVDTNNIEEIQLLMRDELMADDIKEMTYEPFYPAIANNMSPVVSGIDFFRSGDNVGCMTASLGGFFGTRKRQSANMVLAGDCNVPIYAYWKFGEGSVGSFMCDIGGEWSSDFTEDENGRKFILNAVSCLMPLEDIRETKTDCVLLEENYINRLSVLKSLEEGQYIEGSVYLLSNGENEEKVLSLNETTELHEGEILSYYTRVALSSANNYSRSTFVLKKPGAYRINIKTFNKDGTLADETNFHKAISYSKEYDIYAFEGLAPREDAMNDIANKLKGVVIGDIEDPYEVFESYDTDVHYTFDPRYLFAILVIVLLLLDIAVRKFKFKWPHEIIRSIRQKKA